jgi:hypothetical protein
MLIIISFLLKKVTWPPAPAEGVRDIRDVGAFPETLGNKFF